jgi:hypothetical protein
VCVSVCHLLIICTNEQICMDCDKNATPSEGTSPLYFPVSSVSNPNVVALYTSKVGVTVVSYIMGTKMLFEYRSSKEMMQYLFFVFTHM